MIFSRRMHTSRVTDRSEQAVETVVGEQPAEAARVVLSAEYTPTGVRGRSDV